VGEGGKQMTNCRICGCCLDSGRPPNHAIYCETIRKLERDLKDLKEQGEEIAPVLEEKDIYDELLKALITKLTSVGSKNSGMQILELSDAMEAVLPIFHRLSKSTPIKQVGYHDVDEYYADEPAPEVTTEAGESGDTTFEYCSECGIEYGYGHREGCSDPDGVPITPIPDPTPVDSDTTPTTDAVKKRRYGRHLSMLVST
jgi:hypothetical protein